MTEFESAELCDQREHDSYVWWGCTEQLGHDDGGWHYDPLAGKWWRRTKSGVGVDAVSDPDHLPATRAGGKQKEQHMSFSFQAAGHKDQVLAQLATVKSDGIGNEVAEMLSRHIAAGQEHTWTGENGTVHQMGYIVEASGHSGHGSAPTLNVSLKAVYLPVVPAAEAEAVNEGSDTAAAE